MEHTPQHYKHLEVVYFACFVILLLLVFWALYEDKFGSALWLAIASSSFVSLGVGARIEMKMAELRQRLK